MREKDWMQTILDAARVLGWQCIHQFDSRRTAPGWPDIVCCRDGRMIAIEVKTESGKVTPAQEHWLSLLGAVPGVDVMLAKPSDWDAVVAMLQCSPEDAIDGRFPVTISRSATRSNQHNDANIGV